MPVIGGNDIGSLEILIAVQNLAQGGCLAFPPGAPELAVYEPEGDWREEMRRGLEAILPRWAPEPLATLLLRRGELLEVEVEVGLRSRELDRGGDLRASFPCLVSRKGADLWVTALRLGHSFHAGDKDDLAALAAAEIGRVLRARVAAGEDVLRLLPAAATSLELLPIRLGGQRVKTGRKEQREADLALLAEVGTPYLPSAEGLLERPLEEGRLAPLLAAKRRGSVLVAGGDGVGKSALIRRVLAGRQQVYLTSGYQWVAGQSLAGQLEERVEKVMAAAQRLDAILYFERFDELLTARSGGDDLLSLFRRFVTGDQVRLLGELASDRLDEAQRTYTSLFAAMTVVRVEPLGADATRSLLLGRLEALLPEPAEKGLRETLADAALELSRRYFASRPLPGIAVQLLDELSASEAQARAAGRHVELADLYRLVSERTGIPEILLRDDTALHLDALRSAFRARLVGQEAAVEQLVALLATVKARLQPEGKPLAVLLFVGPTGVGKTEAARSLAGLLFGDEKRLVRFDMSEYADRWAAERLIRGNDREEGLLTRQVRREPFAVVLLDEIEKADRAVFDLLLQVAGEGRLTDGRGRTVSFHNVILILTSNLGVAEQRGGKLGFSGAAQNVQAFYRGQVEDYFRPEMVNRLDRVIPFLPLGPAEIALIARLQVAQLAGRRGFAERGIELQVDEEVVEALAAAAQAPGQGARRLRRELQQRLVAPAAELIARLAPRAQLGVLRVSLSSRGSEPAPGLLGRKIAGPFTFELRARGEAPRKPKGETLERLQDLRRLLRRLLRAEKLDTLAQDLALSRRRLFEIQLQLQQLGEESRRLGGRGAEGARSGRRQSELLAEAAQLERRRHRFATALEPLRELRQEIEDAEELALAELLAGEETAGWRGQLEGWLERLRRHLGPALLAPLEGPPLVLLLTEADERKAFELWLRPLLAAAEQAGVALSGWPLGDRGPLGEEARLYGAGLAKWLDTAKRGRQLILEVSDPAWAARLAAEVGWHRFEPEHQAGEAAHLAVARVLRAASSEPQREALRKNHLMRQPPTAETLRRTAYLRQWRIDHEQWWPAGPTAAGEAEAALRDAGLAPFPLLAAEYWRRHDEILSTTLGGRELRGEDGDDRGDRELELEVRLPGGVA